MPEPSHVPLILTPTPLHRLDRLSADLGIDLWIKRDDLTGFAFGGNKGRKLEYLMAEALAQKAEVVVTCGALQSNFIRQLGAACSMFGIQCVAVAMRLPFDRPAGKPRLPDVDFEGGNVRLDRIVGVDVRVIPDDDWEALYAAVDDVVLELRARGRQVYSIPVGGSSPLGAYAFYQAGMELSRQLVGTNSLERFDTIVFASSSGSTQTGLAYAFAQTKTQVVGICSDPEPEMTGYFAELGGGLAPLIQAENVLQHEDFNLNTEFVGEGYGIPSAEGWDAIETMARREGIFLDPIYTGKAFAALLSLAKRGEIGGNVLFWHTGGTPALFAYPHRYGQ